MTTPRRGAFWLHKPMLFRAAAAKSRKAISIEDRRALYAALQRLSSLQRRRLLMRYADRLTYSEIARREGVAPRVAQRSIERALVKLNLMLKDAILVDSNL